MTVSFHKFGDMFFPGTGSLRDVVNLYTLNRTLPYPKS
jgi:acetoin utilization deacetylase AcuC-like enzyme